MRPPKPECAERVEAELKEPRRREQLFRLACRLTYYSREPEDDAKDLVADALEAASNPERHPWDPAKAAFLTHMNWIMRRIAYERARTVRAESEIVDSEVAHEEALADGAPLADHALHARRKVGWLRMLGQKLVASLEKRDPVAAQSLAHGLAGIESHAEQARLIGCEVADIHDAQDRLKYQGQILREDWEKEEARRMRTLREQTRNAKKDTGPRGSEEDR